MRHILRTALFFLLAGTVSAQSASGGRLIEEQAAIDVRHYDLELAVDPEARTINGSCTMRAAALRPVKDVILHLDGRLSVKGVTSNGEDLPFEHAGGLVKASLPQTVPAGSEVEVRVSYGGAPRVAPRPPWDGGFTWSKTKGGKPWIATSCQGEGADLWWPCKDHPSDKPEAMDLKITVPDDLVCASNGSLVSNKGNGDGTRTFHWRVVNPINNYCVALNIAPYVELKRTFTSITGEKVPAYFWALPENKAKAEKFFPEVLDHLKHMEEVCGPYPFRNEKYGVVETPHLGMEHQTIIAYGNKYPQRREFDYDWLHHHEMCHEWWANLVTCRDWKDMWIHEGIGTYMQALYVESRRGASAYKVAMAGKGRHGNRRAIAPREVQSSKEIYFGGGGGNDMYYKGSWVMHTLRWVMGDEKFFIALRRMAYPDPAKEKVTDGTQVRFSDTEEIRGIAEKYHGSDLGWFFEVYLRQAEVPELLAKEQDGQLHLEWKAPGVSAFPMPVAVRVGKEIQVVAMKDGKGTVRLAGQPWELDPDNRILRKQEGRRGRRRGR